MFLLIAACTVFTVLVGMFLLNQGRVGVGGFVGVILLGPVIGAVLAPVIWGSAGFASTSLVSAITAAGNLRRAPSYSLEESLVARGRYAEADDAYQTHLKLHPADLDARFALAALCRDHLQDPARAELLFLECRSGKPTPAQEFAIANALIDLYRATGQAGREMTELARFADRYRDTTAGQRAREALQRLKAMGT
jgi:hypothetical protein